MTVSDKQYDDAGGETRFVFKTREIGGPVFRYTDAAQDVTISKTGRVMIWVALDISDDSKDYNRFEIMRTIAGRVIDWAEARMNDGWDIDLTIGDYDASDTWVGRNDIEADDVQTLRDRLASLNPSPTVANLNTSLTGAKQYFDRDRSRDHAVLLYLSSGEGDMSTLPDAVQSASDWMAGEYPTAPVIVPAVVQNGDFSTVRHLAYNSPEPRLVVEQSSDYRVEDMLDYLTPREEVYSSHPIEIESNIKTSGAVEAASELVFQVGQRSTLVQSFFSDQDLQNILIEVRKKRTRDSSEFDLEWAGRVSAIEPEAKTGKAAIKASALENALSRVGLRRNSQYRCPHLLYGDGCRASLLAATTKIPISTPLPSSSTIVRLPEGSLVNPENFYGGLCWWYTGQRRRVRNIRSIEDGRTLVLDGDTEGLASAGDIYVAKGCPKTVAFCRAQHVETGTQNTNVVNYGGFETIPLDNPHAFKSVFY